MDDQKIVKINSDTSENDELILSSIDKFLEKDVKPYVKEFESEDKYPQDIADKMAELGLFGATISEDYGGLGLSAVTYSKIVENVSSVWMSVSGIFNSHLIMCAAVEKFGTDEMKNFYLPLKYFQNCGKSHQSWVYKIQRYVSVNIFKTRFS